MGGQAWGGGKDHYEMVVREHGGVTGRGRTDIRSLQIWLQVPSSNVSIAAIVLTPIAHYSVQG